MTQTKRLFILVILLALLSAGTVIAGGTYHLKVGETQSLSFTPKTGIRTETIVWTTSRPNEVQITWHVGTSATIKAVKSFTGARAVVQCRYYYIYYVGSFAYQMETAEDFNVYVDPVNPTNITIQGSMVLDVGERTTLTPTVYPSGAETELTWSTSNSSVASVNSTGTIYAEGIGTANVSVRTDNGLSATCRVTVNEPSFTLNSTTPGNNARDISTSTSISASFSLNIYKGIQFENISLTNESLEVQVPGSSSISNGKLSFVPLQTLIPNTDYKFTIPAGALKNQWGTSYASSVDVRFKTSVLELIASIPGNNASRVPIDQVISCDYNVAIQAGTNYDNIQLCEVATNDIILCSVNINDKRLTITPDNKLKHTTKYKVVIPANALNNKQGISHTRADVIGFTTMAKLTLAANPPAGLISEGQAITLTTNVANASIYYTLDGSEPTKRSSLYSGPVVINKSLTLKAVAFCDGYAESEVLTAQYTVPTLKLIQCFPENNAKNVRHNVIIAYTFNEEIRESTEFDAINLFNDDNVQVTGEKTISDNTLYFVPDELLEGGASYKFIIPIGAVETNLAEQNIKYTLSFKIGVEFSSISTGSYHSLATMADGSLWAWGNNDNSELGNGTTTDSHIPVKIADDVTIASAGSLHNAAIKVGGSLWVWGRNNYGQLGDGTTTNGRTPAKIMDGVAAVSASYYSTIVIKTDGSLWAWGHNYSGQLGNGTTTDSYIPVKIMDNVRTVSAGQSHTMVIKTDGSLWGWGGNEHGQLGNGTTIDSHIPIKIMDNVSTVSAGGYHTIVIKTDGSFWIWGSNNCGQLGNGTNADSYIPIKIMDMDDVATVSAGYFFNMVIKTDHSLWAWGRNDDCGQLGNGSNKESNIPVKIIDNVRAVSAGLSNTLAVKMDGSLWAWGRNNCGQLGNGKTTDSKIPLKIWEGFPPAASATNIAFTKTSIKLPAGQKFTSLAMIEPIDIEYNNILQWNSDNENIATVSQRGVVSAIAPGEATITATVKVENGESYSASFKVIVAEASSVREIGDNPLRAWANDDLLHVSGLTAGEVLSVYTTMGTLVYRGIPTSDEMSISLKEHGIYIVRMKGNIVKVIYAN